MREIKKYPPEKVRAALKLLRALPVKDNRITAREALLMLENGIQEALRKGYERTEIRKKIATVDVVISATTINEFLAGKLANPTVEKAEESSGKRKTENPETQNESGTNAEAPDDKTGDTSFGNAEASKGKRGTEEGKTLKEKDTNAEAVQSKTATTPGSIVVKPDTPLEEL